MSKRDLIIDTMEKLFKETKEILKQGVDEGLFICYHPDKYAEFLVSILSL